MISMPEAIDIVLSRAAPLEEESLPFPDAVGRVLASEVTAPRPVSYTHLTLPTIYSV